MGTYRQNQIGLKKYTREPEVPGDYRSTGNRGAGAVEAKEYPAGGVAGGLQNVAKAQMQTAANKQAMVGQILGAGGEMGGAAVAKSDKNMKEKPNLQNTDMILSCGAILVDLSRVHEQLQIRNLDAEATLVNQAIKLLTTKLEMLK